MSWLGKMIFPHAQSDQSRRKMRELCVVIFVGFLITAVMAAVLYLLNKPFHK